jgi:hypothetical protein
LAGEIGGAWGRFVGWSLLFVVLQLILDPAGSIAFIGNMNLGLVGYVNNISPYAVSPILWLTFTVAGLILTLRLAQTRAGWPAAVAFSILATPGLLEYMLMTLLPAIRSPRPAPPVGATHQIENAEPSS